MKSAVLVIDVQSILFDPEPQPFESKVVLDKINEVTKWARNTAVPVVFIQHEQLNSVIEFGSDGWKLQSALVTQVDDYFVRKTTPDSFLNTNLQSLLTELGIDNVIVCGYASEFCVDTTVRRAAGLGYSVTLISDAHTTHDKSHATGAQIRAHHNATLPNISSFGVKIDAIEVGSLLA
ncbi:cysteine hydrolase [Enterovibrio sp. ZSDZ35]|uniref:Cysteine hydrolase n=1 Tax=Enterovibrio qingdaonensis TaxID=2899818 RepID=A0ABT5QS78_9GAMM|nr:MULTISPECIES: cysteine hydrolase family protein [Vibrionaceae]MCY9805884.1 cysteine hydrolase family protein [Vibrio scophthalmi]MDD1783330.1 cysteine hydrolase [Enterovibrio sp. ZSDZ35]